MRYHFIFTTVLEVALDKNTIAITNDDVVIDVVIKSVEDKLHKLQNKKNRIMESDSFYLTNPKYRAIRHTRFELLDLLTEFRTLKENIIESELELSSVSEDNC